MLEVNNLIKKYSGNTALDGVSFKADGGILGLLGPNGAGKSTTMSIITGYIPSDEGTVTVDGYEIYSNPIQVKQRIGYLPEIPPLYDDMTVKAYLNFVYALKGVKTPDKKEHISQIMSMTHTDEISGRLIKNLSKGNRQCVGIAQALIGNPEILIFDEPTVGLDPARLSEIRELIRDLGKEHTVIISSHILSEISSVCDRIIVMNNGKIAADLKTDELSAAFSKRKKLRLEIDGAPERVTSALKRISGITDVVCNGEVERGTYSYSVEHRSDSDIQRAVFKAMAAADCPIVKMDSENRSLEQLFLQLTSNNEKGNTKVMKKGGKNK